MENTYLGILRGKMLPMEISATMLLKGAEDKIFFLETKQMSGFTTKVTLQKALLTFKEQDPGNDQLKTLMDELNSMKISNDMSRAAADVQNGQSLLKWIEIE